MDVGQPLVLNLTVGVVLWRGRRGEGRGGEGRGGEGRGGEGRGGEERGEEGRGGGRGVILYTCMQATCSTCKCSNRVKAGLLLKEQR